MPFRVIASLFLPGAVTAAAADAPWRPRFNGREDTGWKLVGARPRAATCADDGALAGHIVRSRPEHTFLCTEESFDDFILERERFQTGGLLRRVATPPDAAARLRGHQVRSIRHRRGAGPVGFSTHPVTSLDLLPTA